MRSVNKITPHSGLSSLSYKALQQQIYGGKSGTLCSLGVQGAANIILLPEKMAALADEQCDGHAAPTQVSTATLSTWCVCGKKSKPQIESTR